MSENSGSNESFNLPVPAGETDPSQIPLTLQWLQATDPRIFTPYAWENGRQARITFRSSDKKTAVRAERYISRYINGAELTDELHMLDNYSEVSGLKYKISNSGTIVEARAKLGDHMEKMISIVTQLVHDKGAKITAMSGLTTRESHFESDGTQWIDMMAGEPRVVKLPEIEVGNQLLEEWQQGQIDS